MLNSINYDESKSSFDEEEASAEEEMSTYNRNSISEVAEFHSSVGDIVIVYYELNKNILRYLSLVQDIENKNISVSYLK